MEMGKRQSRDICRAYAELKRKLAGSGIRLGVLIQSMIGMGRPAFPPTSKFQHTINHKGVPSQRMYPLAPGFQEYCRHIIGSLAELGPEWFLLDDDTRLLDNDKLECPACQPLVLQIFS